MIKICVTGNSGFIGKRLQRALERIDYIVIGVDDWIFSRPNWRATLNEYLDKISPNAVFHVGACSDTTVKDVRLVMEKNVESTIVITDWCKQNSVPMIYSSSAAVVGNGGEPENLYGWGKLIGERYAVSHGAIALRYFNVYGPGEAHKGRMASMAYQCFLNNKAGSKTQLFQKNPVRDFVYVEDVVHANLHAWERFESLKKAVYEVGSGVSRSFEDLVRLMGGTVEYLPESSIPSWYQFNTKADPGRFMPGWSPAYDLESGIEAYLRELSK